MEFSRQEYWSGVPLPSPLYYLLKLKIHLLAEAIQQKKNIVFSTEQVDIHMQTNKKMTSTYTSHFIQKLLKMHH